MPFTKKQLKILKEKLLAKKRDLKEQIKKLGALPDFGTDIDHFEEETDEIEEVGNRLSAETTLRQDLATVEKALERMRTSKYGFCEKCGSEIGFKVLEVEPESFLCQKCKKARKG